MSKEGHFLKDLANKLDGLGASTTDAQAGRIMNAIQDKEEVFVKIEEEIDTVKNHIEESSVTYWLNKLQNLQIDKNIFLTINPIVEIPEKKIFKIVQFTHPYSDKYALEKQSQLNFIQNKENI